MNILFKTENGLEYHKRLAFEFYNQIDGRVRAIYLEANDYSYRKFGIQMVLTCLNRTKEENKKAGGVEWSAHLYCRAGDSRTRTMTPAQIDELIAHIKSVWGDMVYIKYHNAGSGHHLHINIKYAYRRDVF